ncbi:hypothetical protein ACB094_05G051500 [Castanea mollissima]
MGNLDQNHESRSNPKQTRIEVDVANLPTNLGLRIKISNYHPNERDQIRRHYLQNRFFQLVDHDFPQSQFGKTKRRFNPLYIMKDATYCLYCYLFQSILPTQSNSFRSHDESKDSNNQGNFLELLQFFAKHKEEIDKVVLKNAPENHQMIFPYIQKEIANAAAVETINAIVKDIEDSLFAIIVDESRDMSTKEQLAIALSYVDKLGHVNEHFLGIAHVNNIAAMTLNSAIEEIFNKHSLSISRLWGQSYNGESNMRDELNGLKTLILKDNSSAYYVHYFAHQLQLTLVAIAKNHIQIATFFNLVAKVFNIVGASCKRHDILRKKRSAKVIEALKNNEISTGRGLKQEMSLKRPGDTCWSSHYGALVNLIHMFSSVIDVIETIIEDGLDSNQRAEANILIVLLQTFEFVFNLHLMKGVLSINIVNALKLVNISKQRLQVMRDDGWNSLLEEVYAFCAKYNIDVLDMDDLYQPWPRKKAQNMKNSHHYQMELFYTTYIHDMRSTKEFSVLKGIGQLAEKMVEMKEGVSYPLVYSLVTLALILLVAIATAKRAFSTMNIIKNRLHSRTKDQWMNDYLVTYIEKDIFKTIECEETMQRLQSIKNRQGHLSKLS